MALHTALLMMMACLGLVCLRPQSVLVRMVVGDSIAGILIRRLLPAAIILPPVLGWLRWQGELLGLYETAFGLALFATSNVAMFVVLVWWSARTVQQFHEQKLALARTSAWQEAILDSADLTVISTDVQGSIQTINVGAAHQLGYAQAELLGQTPGLIHDAGEVIARAEVLTHELGRRIEPGFEAFVAKAVVTGCDEKDWTYVRKDGTRFPVRLSVTPLLDRDGVLHGFVGIGKNISSQRAVEEALRDSEHRMRLITDNLPALVAYIDREQRYRYANAMIGKTFGVDVEEMIGRTMCEVRGESIYADIRGFVERALTGELVSFEGKAPAGNRDYHYRSTYVPDIDAFGGVRGFYAMTFDISELKANELRLQQSEARLRLITDNVPALIGYIDRDYRFRFNNSTYATWLQRPLDKITGKHLDEVYDAETYALLRPEVEKALQGEVVKFAFRSPATNRYVEGTYVPDFGSSNRPVGVYGFITDVTVQKHAEEQLRHLAQFDSLTGLANRSRLGDCLSESIARSERSGRTMALIFLDLDDFKSINDTLGHQGGDLVLQEFARRLTQSVRATDTVARLAGDEFVVVLEGLNHPDEVEIVATNIVAAMEPTFRVLGETRRLSTSMGVAVRQPGETSGDAPMQRADHALYKVKSEGKGHFLVAG